MTTITRTAFPSISTGSVVSLRDNWKQWPPELQQEFLTRLNDDQPARLNRSFRLHCHDHQLPPEIGNNGEPWTTWLLIGGRGAGKTRAGAEWIKRLATAPKQQGETDRRIALIGETEHETREVMIEGVSGLLAVHPRHARPLWSPTRRRLEWNNGAIAQAFSAEDPESLRGPQFSAAWADELAKWRRAEATFDMLQFGLRLGARPRQVITTTPRPLALLKRLIADPSSVVTYAATRANARYLSPAFIDTVVKRYAGTRLGRQELDGEMIDDRPDALWTRGGIESCRVVSVPPLQRIVVAVDPPVSASKGADACGLIAAGRGENDIIYVIADETASGLSPAAWAARAIALWRRVEADALVVEVNQGGDMVRSVIREADASVPVIAVRAHRGKWLRAEPVAALYEQERVKHAGVFAALEDEMADFGLDGLSSGRSPDRLDAMVWAVTHLTFGARTGPRMRGL